VSSGVRRYDKQYFGLYASHTQGTNNKSVYKDDRANIFKNKKLQLAVVAFFTLAYYGITNSMAFFQPNEPEAVKAESVPHPNPQAQPVQPVATPSQTAAPHPQTNPEVAQPPERPSLDIFDQEARKGRLRLAALLYNNDKIYFRIEIMDSYSRLLATYDYKSLHDLGWHIENRDSGIHLTKQDQIYVARPWQLENSYAKVDRRTSERL